MSRMLGVILIIAAVGILVLSALFLVAGVVSGNLEPAGAILGFVLAVLVLGLPLLVGGIVVLNKSSKDESEGAEAQAQRKILDMVEARGQVDISEVIIELQSDLPTVQNMIYKLVGMGVFSGYINWDEGQLYSDEAASLHEMTKCKHCGGEVSFAGKGVLRCPFCGTEYFIAK